MEVTSCLQVIKGDARRIPLPDGSVQCVVTSPPYWGLRRYSGQQDLIWGGREGCEHQWFEQRRDPQPHGDNGTGGNLDGGRGSQAATRHLSLVTGHCSLCGAWRGAFGLEPSVEMYVAHTVEVLREIRRVLREDGVVFWNLGDSYCSTAPGTRNAPMPKGSREHAEEWANVRPAVPVGLKPKDLCLIPDRVALAAQGFATVSAKEILRAADWLAEARRAEDWNAVLAVEGLLRTWATWAEALEPCWVRSVIIWSKPNPMPESVRDRPTDAFEYILMLTKSERYFWDAEAVKETATEPPHKCGKNSAANVDRDPAHGTRKQDAIAKRTYVGFNDRYDFENPNPTRNLRNVWTFPTQPYSGAHFATFPEELPRRCIKAATSEKGACAQCGAPWERVVEKAHVTAHDGKTETAYESGSNGNRLSLLRQAARERGEEYHADVRTLGWRPTCTCRGQHGKTVPCLVLDPFGGSGTTAKVAIELGRSAVLVDIAYQDLAEKRTKNLQPEFLFV